MNWTVRRRKIVFFACLSLSLIGLSLYTGESLTGVLGTLQTPVVPGPKPVVPPVKPVVPPVEDNRLPRSIRQLIPSDSTVQERKEVAAVFTKVADRPDIKTPVELLGETSKELTIALGERRGAWVDWGAALQSELKQRRDRNRLSKLSEYVTAWHQVAELLGTNDE